MATTKIIWKSLPSEGDPLTVLNPESFIFAIKTAFPGREFPITLRGKDDLLTLQGMAAATLDVGNPYLDLVQHLKRFKAIVVWPDYVEVKE